MDEDTLNRGTLERLEWIRDRMLAQQRALEPDRPTEIVLALEAGDWAAWLVGQLVAERFGELRATDEAVRGAWAELEARRGEGVMG